MAPLRPGLRALAWSHPRSSIQNINMEAPLQGVVCHEGLGPGAPGSGCPNLSREADERNTPGTHLFYVPEGLA